MLGTFPTGRFNLLRAGVRYAEETWFFCWQPFCRVSIDPQEVGTPKKMKKICNNLKGMHLI